MKYIGIFTNRSRDAELSATKELCQALISCGKVVLIDRSFESELGLELSFVSTDEMLCRADMIIALGGDGTILKIMADAADHNTPVIGINLGHLGFLTQAEKDDASILDKIFSGDFTINNAMMLEARIYRNNKIVSRYRALNDITMKGDDAKMLSLHVEVDGTVTNRYLADGIIVATSTGSTAYSLSCGGPIVHQSLDCMLLTPICPHTLKSRCIIIPPSSSVVLKFDPSYCSETDIKADGSIVEHLREGDYVEIVRAEKSAPLINLNGRNYFDVIREKLSD